MDRKKLQMNILFGIIICNFIMITIAFLFITLEKLKSSEEDPSKGSTSSTSNVPNATSNVRSIPLEDHCYPRPSRIVGGMEATPHSQPWMVHVMSVYAFRSIKVTCAGTAISKRWVLTAAHCFDNHPGFLFGTVTLGSHDMSKRGEERAFVHSFGIKDIHYPPNRWLKHNTEDLALVYLRRPVPSDQKNVEYACLPFDMWQPKKEDYCFASGWGRVSQEPNRKQLPNKLHTVGFVKVTPCVPRLPMIICTKKPDWIDFDQETCYGDSGSPLVCLKDSIYPRVVGVLSVGSKECNGNDLAHYSRTMRFLDWIKDTIRKNS